MWLYSFNNNCLCANRLVFLFCYRYNWTVYSRCFHLLFSSLFSLHYSRNRSELSLRLSHETLLLLPTFFRGLRQSCEPSNGEFVYLFWNVNTVPHLWKLTKDKLSQSPRFSCVSTRRSYPTASTTQPQRTYCTKISSLFGPTVVLGMPKCCVVLAVRTLL